MSEFDASDSSVSGELDFTSSSGEKSLANVIPSLGQEITIDDQRRFPSLFISLFKAALSTHLSQNNIPGALACQRIIEAHESGWLTLVLKDGEIFTRGAEPC